MKKNGLQQKVLAFFLWFPMVLLLLPLAILLAFLPIFPTKTAVNNFSVQLKVSKLKVFLLVIGLYLHYFVYAIENLILLPLGLIVVQNEPEFAQFLVQMKQTQLQTNTKGFALCGGHFGNIEVLGRSLSRIYDAQRMQYWVLAKPSPYKWLTLVLDKYRKFCNIRLLWTDRKDLVKQIIRICKQGDSIAFLIDQKPEKSGIFVQFFENFAAFPFRGLDIPIRQKIPIYFLTAKRCWPGVFELRYSCSRNEHVGPAAWPQGNQPLIVNKICWNEDSKLQPFVAKALAELAGWMQGLITESPTQWCWDYRKWSRKPTGCQS